MFKETSSQHIDSQNIQVQLPDLDRKKSVPPAALQDTIRRKNLETLHANPNIHGSIMLRWSSKFKQIRLPNHCSICEVDSFISPNLYIADCEHRGSHCFSCLQHYAVYIIDSQFTKVRCPVNQCNQELDTNGIFFRSLPANIQVKYNNILNFYAALENPNVKTCPKDGCQGLLVHEEGSLRMACQQCRAQFCAKCFLAFHQGDCDSYQLQFFQKNLHYRQCSHCKMVIDKFEGCNHMTCRCGYQFCYICGADWSPPHYQNHDQNGVFIPPPAPNADLVNVEVWRPAVMMEAQEEQEQEEGCCASMSTGMCLTLPLRIIAAVVIYALIIAAFGVVIALTILASLGRSKKSNSSQRTNKAVSQCIDNMCLAYFQLYPMTWELLFKK